MIRKRFGAALLAGAVVGALALTPAAASAAPGSTTKVGAWSKDWKWFDDAVGPVDIYRGYDSGFRFATWQQTDAYARHPNARQNDYSFRLEPALIANWSQDAKLKKFIASTPKNINLTNMHEPEQEIEAGHYTAEQYRRSIVRLTKLVRAQNAVDGGNRTVSVTLMILTFSGFKDRDPENYWPTQARDGGTADMLSVDAYALPHATGTPGVPIGYTDGVNWKLAQALLKPALVFANKYDVPWGISELAYLEDVNNANRRAQALINAVNYARAGKETPTSPKPARPAKFVEYWDSQGGRADWELRYSNPVPSESKTSNAVQAWKMLVAQP